MSENMLIAAVYLVVGVLFVVALFKDRLPRHVNSKVDAHIRDAEARGDVEAVKILRDWKIKGVR